MSSKFLAALAVVMISTAAAANETVKMVWPFGPGSGTVPYRAMIEQANQAQRQHQFVLDLVTGGGGSLAVAAVANSATPAVLAHSSAIFLHPRLSDTATYNISDWRLIKHVCDLPFMIASKQWKNIKDVPKDRPITVGASGLNTTTHLVQQWFQARHPNWQIVAYKTAAAALTDVMGGHLDLAVSPPGDVIGHFDAGALNVFGVTGRHPVKTIPTFASQGYSGSEQLVGAYYIFVNRRLDQALQESWKNLFNQINQQEVDRAVSQIHCGPVNTKVADLDKEFARADQFWGSLAARIKK